MIRRTHAKRAAAGLAVVSLSALLATLGAGCGGSDYADADDASPGSGGDGAADGTTASDGSSDGTAARDANGDATRADGGGDATTGGGDASDGGDQTGDTGADARADGGLDASVNLDGALDARIDANLNLDAGLDANLNLDAGFDANLNLDAGLDANLNLDAGLDANLNLDAGLDATLNLDASLPLDASIDANVVLDASLDAGFDGSLAQRPLGSASAFAVLAGNSVSNFGATTVLGDVGVSPGTNITGFPSGQPVGNVHPNDAVAIKAQADLVTAATFLGSRACSPLNNRTGTDLGGKTLTPGVYCFDSAASISGALFLDGQGDPEAQWIFQIAGTLTTSALSSVAPTGLASSCNVYWNVGGNADIGAGASFRGNLVAQGTISVGSATNIIFGRVLSHNGIVNLGTDTVSKGTCP